METYLRWQFPTDKVRKVDHKGIKWFCFGASHA